MKRNPHLVPLSRDHHTALLFCWKIRQGLQLNIAPERLAAYADYFFVQHLSAHFDEEEKLLFLDKTDPLVLRAIKEHDLIRQIICSSKSKDNLILLAQTLDDHIRFEERILFPHLENTIDNDTLEYAGNCLLKEHVQQDNYPDEFWIRPI